VTFSHPLAFERATQERGVEVHGGTIAAAAPSLAAV